MQQSDRGIVIFPRPLRFARIGHQLSGLQLELAFEAADSHQQAISAGGTAKVGRTALWIIPGVDKAFEFGLRALTRLRDGLTGLRGLGNSINRLHGAGALRFVIPSHACGEWRVESHRPLIAPLRDNVRAGYGVRKVIMVARQMVNARALDDQREQLLLELRGEFRQLYLTSIEGRFERPAISSPQRPINRRQLALKL
jgi:hypothetical protein